MTILRKVAPAIALAIATFAAAPAFAYDGVSVETEFQVQKYKIDQGVRSGALTRHEAAVLRAEQDHIALRIARARADGRIDAFERYQIERLQEIARRHIYAEKHDREVADAPVRPVYGWWHRPRSWSY